LANIFRKEINKLGEHFRKELKIGKFYNFLLATFFHHKFPISTVEFWRSPNDDGHNSNAQCGHTSGSEQCKIATNEFTQTGRRNSKEKFYFLLIEF
jgi:hypothetical protein